jgi:O-antigen/teichoic acid export membrane protein
MAPLLSRKSVVFVSKHPVSHGQAQDSLTAAEASGESNLSPGLGSAGISFLVNALLVLVSAVVTSRLYGVQLIGLYALSIAPWQLLVSLSTVSEQVAMVRALAQMRPGSDEATGLFFAVFVASVGLTILMAVPVMLISRLVLSGPIDQPDTIAPAMLILAGYVLLENPGWNLDSVLSAFSQGKSLFWARFSVVFSFLVATVLLRAFTASIWGLAIGTVVSFAVGLVVRIVLIRGMINPLPTREHLRLGARRLPTLLRFGLGLVPGQVFIGATLQLPLIIVANSVGLREVGAYSRASTMAVRLNEAGFRINEMLFPDLVRYKVGDDMAGFAATLKRVVRLALIGLALIGSIAGGAAEAVMGIFGDGFSSAAGALTLLVLVHVCYMSASVIGSGFNALGRPYLNSMCSAIRFFVGLSLVVILTSRYGVTAAAGGLLVGYVVEVGARVFWFHRLLGGQHGWLIDGRDVFGLVVSYGATFGVIRLLSLPLGHGPLSIVVGTVVGALMFLAVSSATGLLDQQDRVMVGGAFNKVRRRRQVPHGPSQGP